MDQRNRIGQERRTSWKSASRGKNKGWGSIIVLVVLFLVSMLENISVEAISWIIVVALIAGVGLLFGWAFSKALKRKKAGIAQTEIRRSYTSHENHQPRKYDPTTIRDRDAVRRLEQLDSFLKNGLIDKKEYDLLRSHYERYVEGL